MKKLLLFLISASHLLASPLDEKWAHDQIDNDFAPYLESRITEEMLQKTICNFFSWSHLPPSPKTALYRYRVVNSAIYIHPQLIVIEDYIGYSVIKVLEKIIQKYGLPDCEFIFLNGDLFIKNPSQDIDVPGPILVSSKNPLYKNCIFYHDYCSLNNVEENPLFKKCRPIKKREFEFQKRKNFFLGYDWKAIIKIITTCNIPWEEKQPLLFWRGRSSDHLHAPNNKLSPRQFLAHLSLLHPSFVDAAIIGCDPSSQLDHIRYDNHATIDAHLLYKYQIAIDGVTSQYPGYAWRLLSHSLVFKQSSDDKIWFEAGLVEGKHYVSVKNDLSDLVEKIKFYQEHDVEAKKIAAAAQKFAVDNLLPDSIIDYCYLVLMKYISLQDFSEGYLTNLEGFHLVSEPLKNGAIPSAVTLLDPASK